MISALVAIPPRLALLIDTEPGQTISTSLLRVGVDTTSRSCRLTATPLIPEIKLKRTTAKQDESLMVLRYRLGIVDDRR